MPQRAPVWATGIPSTVLTVDGVPVSNLWTTERRAHRRVGLLGTDGLEGALWIDRCNSVHTFGMRYAIDVAFVNGTGTVLGVTTMSPRRWGWTRLRARAVVEAPAGMLTAWSVRRGTTLGRGVREPL